MKKTVIGLLLATSINAHASITGFVQAPYGAIFAGYSRPIANKYNYKITNNTSVPQTYNLHAELCPVEFRCKENNMSITLQPGKSESEEFIIQQNVIYKIPGIRGVRASMMIIGESNYQENKEGRIDVS